MIFGGVLSQQFGQVGGNLYTDIPPAFPAKVTAVLTSPPTDLPEVTSDRLGFVSRKQNPDTGEMEDDPDGPVSDGTASWVVVPDGQTFAVGDEITIRRHSQHGDRYEIVQTGGGGSGAVVSVVYAREANDGLRWTAAYLLDPAAVFTAAGDFPSTPSGADIEVRALSGILRAGLFYPAVLAGTAPRPADPPGGPYTGVPRYRVLLVTFPDPVNDPVCDPVTGALGVRTRQLPSIDGTGY